ncbi:hypothetical protein ACTG9Q_04725 [Actinokineospora sp. 24-640]
MRTDFDDLLRETLHNLADHAPDESAVRAALDRSRRPRFALVAVAAAVLLVAVAVPLLRVGDEGGTSPARFPSAAPREAWVGLNPTWLPPGITEQARTASRDNAIVTRHWHSGPLDEHMKASLTLRAEYDGPTEGGQEAVDLGAMGSGRYFDEHGVRGVAWKHGRASLRLFAPFRLTDRDTLVRIARGIRQGEGPPLRTSLEFGLPAGRSPSHLTYGVRSTATGASVLFTTSLDTGGRLLTAELAPIDPVIAAPDLEVTVLGRPARVITHRPLSESAPTETLVVDLDGRWLVVRHYADSPDLDRVPMLVEVAETMRIGPDVDNPWLGTR